ncbi:MAG TPA: hypothetical protein DIU15_02805, partial [Deltaproteobacteria bacterium]|nr:hypothetical protein [Deltaproteobacteria bacterium]
MTRWLLPLVPLMGAALVLSCAGPSSTPTTETATTALTSTAPASGAPARGSKEPAPSDRHTAVPPSHGSEELRVLFVGNSYTSSHDLPVLVKQIAEASQPPPTIHTQMVSFPGYSLEQHWERGEALKTIQESAWDVVVLQDHSLQSIAAPEALFQASQSFAEAIKGTGARVLFFVT